MKTTTVKMKDGRTLCAAISIFRPNDGYLTLYGSDEKLCFNNMVSAVTELSIVGYNQNGAPRIETTDELERAARNGWSE